VSGEKAGTLSEQNTRNNMSGVRDQTLLTSDKGLPLINERSENCFQQRVETMGTPQTKVKSGTNAREDTQTERGLL